ncbi:two-component regulator propeller domain-containing protein [Pseudopedobacter sp.]|uniref:hybrid sensor histidine kinase/response regulator transcription factor n=1 Tax=Pseudopedobacter sp. TaxID=1936787 RepID=UPI0033409FE4
MAKLLYYFSFITVLSLIPNYTFAQPRLDFDHLTVENGLSQSSIFAIAQDKKGFMWFGSKDGLNKFNGHYFEVYRTGNSEKDYIVALQADQNGNLWIGTKKGLKKYIYSEDSFLEIGADPKKNNSLDSYIINCIYQSPDNTIWVGTDKGLNKLINDDRNSFQQLSGKIEGLEPGKITAIFQDRNKNLWLGTPKGLTKVSYKNGVYFTNHQILSNNKSSEDITSIVEDDENNLWLGTKSEGIINYNPDTKKVTRFYQIDNEKNSLINNNIRKILKDENGNLWIATLKGLCFLNPKQKRFTTYTHNPGNPKSLNHNSIYDICIDNQKSIWLGTYYGGVNVAYSKTTLFQTYRTESVRNSLSSNVISTIIEDKENLWIGTEAEGLNYFNKKSKTFTHFKHIPEDPNSLSSDLVTAIYKDTKGQLWVGTVGGGLNLLSSDGKSFIHFKNKAGVNGTLSNNNVASILEDNKGRFWVGTMGGGLNILNPDTKTFTTYGNTKTSTLSSNWVKVIFKDSKQNLWIGTHDGIKLLREQDHAFKLFSKENSGLTSNLITSITESAGGYIWIGTNYGGLNCFNLKNGEFSHYTTSDGLPSNNIMAIIEDNNHLLWISTDNGLSCFDIKDKTFRNYNKKDGLPGNVFNSNSCLKTKNGELYFGSFNGLVSFYPTNIQKNDSTYPVVFTGLKLFNEKVQTNADDGILKMNITEMGEINLSYNQNTFTLEFSSLNLIKSFKNKYAYKLEGAKGDWVYTSTPAVTYTNLSPGSYTILVKSANSDGIWNQMPSKIRIHIAPPLWKTWWAYLLYVILLGIIAYLIVNSLISKSRLKRDLYYEHLENTRQQAHYQMQMDFFTNISHELRTPLTLIVGPLDNAVQEVPEDSKLRHHLNLAKKNAGLLLKLVNELMDFRKVEAGQMKIHPSWHNLPNFIRNIFEFFTNEAVSRHINYQLKVDNITEDYFFDKDQLEKVIFNLLSNAFKFTPDSGSVRVRVSQETNFLTIIIEDDGEGIPEENVQNLFTRFYQIETQGYRKNSSGVGLALAKAIIEMHHGSIAVESDSLPDIDGFKTKFIIKLPLNLPTITSESVSESKSEFITVNKMIAEEGPFSPVQTISQNSDSKLTVLLVEDNNNMRAFIREEIAHLYQVIEAENGEQGLEIAKEVIPDIIISDSMMPIMDGLELCRQIKTDEATAHIPVILLTAKSEDSNKLEGLETGANVYITKPFNTKWLLLNMNNLMVAREAIRQRFSKKISLEPNDVEMTSGDERFIEKLISIIENNMESSDFGVATLTQEIGMSKNVLYRKVNALTGLSVGDFIKSIKLKKAAILLKKKHLPISEVAFYAGFNDTKYFGKEFKKHFGKSPSQYRSDLDETESG